MTKVENDIKASKLKIHEIANKIAERNIQGNDNCINTTSEERSALLTEFSFINEKSQLSRLGVDMYVHITHIHGVHLGGCEASQGVPMELLEDLTQI